MPTGFSGAIFDVDGVLVDSPHERAWRDTLRELMDTSWQDIRSQTMYSPERFTPRVYQSVVSGKPRMSGARAALDHFQVPDAAVRVEEYAERKQQMVLDLIAAGVSNADIANRLFLSPKTVRNHVSSVFTKLQVADRAQAIVRARAAGLGVAPGDRR